MKSRKSRTRRRTRRAVAVVEFAVCLPMLMVLFVGMIECCSMIFLKQSLAVAAYEGMHVALKPDATIGDVQQTCDDILTQRGVRNASVVLDPVDLSSIDPGAYFTLRVSAPAGANSLMPIRFFGSKELVASATMMKEI